MAAVTPPILTMGLMDVDRVINHYRNLFGKKSVVIVSSQNGTPIGVFQGDNCRASCSALKFMINSSLSIRPKHAGRHDVNIATMDVDHFAVDVHQRCFGKIIGNLDVAVVTLEYPNRLPEVIETHGGTSTGLMDVDRVINHYRNLFGKKSVVIVI